jgi:hypothetical protein
LPVISTTLAMEVSGACAAAANTAPIAITPYAAGAPAAGPNKWWTMMPKAVLAIAPVNSDGAKTPPEPPIPMARLAVTIFAAIRKSRNHRTSLPTMAWFITG